MNQKLNAPNRRLFPRISHTDWLVLKHMRLTIDDMARGAVEPGMHAMDFGCGDQPYRAIFDSLGAHYRGADLSGADIIISEEGIVAAEDGCADLVLSFQVLEHVRNVRAYLAEARRLLRPGGRLLLSTHGNWLYHPHPEDHRRWTRTGLIAELADAGFVTEQCVALLGPLAWTTLLRLTCAYHACLRLPLLGKPLASLLAVCMNAKAYLEENITPTWVRDDNACVYVTLSKCSQAEAR